MSKLVKNKIVNGIERLYKLGYIENGNSVVYDENNIESVKIEEIETHNIHNIEYVNDVVKTFDSFISTLSSNEQYNINTLQTLYNNYFKYMLLFLRYFIKSIIHHLNSSTHSSKRLMDSRILRLETWKVKFQNCLSVCMSVDLLVHQIKSKLCL